MAKNAVDIKSNKAHDTDYMDCYKSFEYKNEAFARLCATEDAQEGIHAFLGKRKAVWKEK